MESNPMGGHLHLRFQQLSRKESNIQTVCKLGKARTDKVKCLPFTGEKNGDQVTPV